MKKQVLILLFIPLLLIQVFGPYRAVSKGVLADGDITSIVVSDDADVITITVNGAYSTNYLTYINTDDNVNTGLYLPSWSGGGADYLIQGTALFKYSGVAGAWGWTSVGTVTVSEPSATERILFFDKKDIAVPSLALGDVIYVGYTDDGDAFPDTAVMQSYTLTSDTNLISISTTEDATNLYVTITGTAIESSWDLFIDIDNSSTTGHTESLFGTTVGADFLIEQWTAFFEYSGTAGAWGWTQDGAITVVSSTTTEVIVQIPLSKLGTYGDVITVGFANEVSFAHTDIIPATGGFESHSFSAYIWDGSVWDDGTPTATDNVMIAGDYNAGTLATADLMVNQSTTLTISSGETLEVNGDLVNEGSILIESGGSLITYDANSISGNAITFERNTRYSDGKYSFVGTPVMEYPTITGSVLGTDVYRYNEVTAYDADAGLARWEDASVDQLIAGVGYTQAFQQALLFSGIPNAGTITVSGLSHTNEAGTTASERGWNLVSNPYPAAIDVTAFIADNSAIIGGSVYLWDDHGSNGGRGDNGDYQAVNAIGALSGPNGGAFNGYIGSSQGFFVQVTSEIADASVVFNESQRVSGSNLDANFFRKMDSNIDQTTIRVSLSGDYYNETLLGFRDDATLGQDYLFDAKKLIGNQNIAFYSILDDNKYAIQGFPALATSQSVSLGYDLAESGEYKLGLVEASNLPEGFNVVLVDTNTGLEYNLTTGGDATLDLSAGSNVSGYELQLRSAAILDVVPELVSDLNIYMSNDELNIELSQVGFESANINIYDLSGAKVVSFKGQDFGGKNWSSPVRLTDDKIYILTIDNGMNVLSKKFIK